jgi:dipeptidyl aminopeptidase/acylaminoacyl peptidase
MQKIKNENDKPALDGEPIDLLLNQRVCSPPLEGGTEAFSISPDEKYIAFAGHKKDEEMAYNTKWDIYLYNVTNKTFEIITEDEEEGRCQNPAFDETSNKLAFLCMDRKGLESDYLKMRIYDVDTMELRNSTNQNNWKPSVTGFVWSNSNDEIFIYNVIEEGYLKLYEYKFKEEASQAFTLLTNDTNGYTGSPIKLDENKYLIEYSSFTFPTLIGILNKTSDFLTASEIVNLNKEKLQNYSLNEPQPFYYNTSDGTSVQGFILKPINFDESKKYPLAFLIHGGPEGAWDNVWSYRWNPQMWANHGYVVVFINPRGSSGMGIDFQDAVRNNWGGAPFNDLMEGFDYVIETYNFIDANRTGACGASYGGYMINWIQGNDDKHRFNCFVTHDGVFSTVTMFYATEELWFPMAEYCEKENLGCKPYNDTEREGYERYNPERFVNNWSRPHLIIHGGRDYRIPISEGISAFTALQLKGIKSRFLYFPDENHWVLKPENSIKWYEEVLTWLDENSFPSPSP